MDPARCGEAFNCLLAIGLVGGEGNNAGCEEAHVVENVSGYFADTKSLTDISEADVGLEKGRFHGNRIRSQCWEGIEMRVFV
jgi:hypothetical protein